MADLILRPYQSESINDLRAGFCEGHGRQVLAAGTGAGKSYLRLRVAPEALVCGKIGGVEIAVEVHKGTVDDAKTHAYGANQSHGLRRTNADKKKAVDGMLADCPVWRDNRIAKHVGVDHKTVVAILGNSQDSGTKREAEPGGKTHTQDTSGQTEAVAKKKEEAAATAEPEAPAPATTTPAAADHDDPRAEEIAAAQREDADDQKRLLLLCSTLTSRWPRPRVATRR